MNSFSVVIPARMNSTRLANKMVLDVVGLPLIVRVAHQAALSKARQVVVATDHEEIYELCQKHNINVIMTSSEHESGTDRISEAVQILALKSDEIIVNLQGDEPLIDPELINRLADFIALKQTAIATIAHPITTPAEIFNPNVVKAVLDSNDLAMYFSRAPIPYYRDGYTDISNFKVPAQFNILRHIGIYAYLASFLKVYHQLPACPLEQTEALEQLRALYNGYKIAVLVTNEVPAAGVDTFEDLVRLRQIIQARENS